MYIRRRIRLKAASLKSAFGQSTIFIEALKTARKKEEENPGFKYLNKEINSINE